MVEVKIRQHRTKGKLGKIGFIICLSLKVKKSVGTLRIYCGVFMVGLTKKMT